MHRQRQAVGWPAAASNGGEAHTRRVGRRRGGGCPLLFRRPLPTPDVHLSAHPAFQCLTAVCTAGPRAVVAFGISPTSLPAGRRHLPPFPLYTAFPCAEYYGGAVALRLAARRAIPHSLDARRVEHDVGGSFAPLRGVILPRPLCGRFERTPSSRPITEAPPVDVVAEDGCLHPWRLDFVQCRSHPIARVLQGRGHTRLLSSPAFTACSGPVWLSPPGQPMTQRPSFRTSPVCDGNLAPGDTAHYKGRE